MNFDVSTFTFSADQLQALWPYLWLCAGIAVVTVLVGCRVRTEVIRVVHSLVLLPYCLLLVWSFRDPAQTLFGTSLQVDSITRLVGIAVGVFAVLSGMFSGHKQSAHTEWSPLMLIAVLGMSLLPGARDWVAFFVYLETLAIAGYVLVALDYYRESSLEASIKYLLMGAFASALLLMGMTLLYGVSGSFDYAVIHQSFTDLKPGDLGLAVTGSFLIVASLGFKVALFPFHMWAPDVYQAAPAGTASFLAAATKVAVFAAAAVAFEKSGFWAMPGVREFVQVLAAASIVFGNLLAVAQKKIRRVMAYSSVANAGYAALALSVGATASGSMLTALIIYGVAVVAAFAMIDVMAQSFGEVGKYDIEISELPRAVALSPAIASLVLALSLFSLAGIPPFPGFLGKYVILTDIWSAGFHSGAIVLVVGTLLGLAYYLKLLVPLYMMPDTASSPVRSRWPLASVCAGCLSMATLVVCLVGFSRLHQWLALVGDFVR